jgi:ferric enterobactin receptor
MKITIVLYKIALSVICIFIFNSLSAQYRVFDFNSPGNKCYIRYLAHTADSNYKMIRRPFVFILGGEDETALQVFEKDTLRTSTQFLNYYFVYLPGVGRDSVEKLDCVEALVSLLTYNYRYGRSNLFFQVNDTAIGRNSINLYGLRTVFKNVRLSSEEKYAAERGFGAATVTEDFRESVSDYAPEEKVEVDLAKYYEEENPDDMANFAESHNLPVKTYFGPPSAMNFTLSGTIRDQATSEALPFATIMIRGTILGTTTNADGLFTLVKVPTDTSTLIVQYVGYQQTPVYLTPSSDKKNMTIEIRPQSRSLDEVTITARKDDVVLMQKAEVSTIRLTPLKMAQLPSLGEKDVMRSLQLMPGISASNESSSGLYVRGGTPDQNLILYDGFTVYHVDHLYGFYSAFNSNAIKDIQLYKGGFESRFGGRISSVTELTSKEGNQKKINFGFDISLLSINVFTEIPIGSKFSSFIAFRRSYQGSVYDMIFKKFSKTTSLETPDLGAGMGRRFYREAEVISFFYDLNGKFTFRPSGKDIISLSLYNGTDKLDNSTSGMGMGLANASFTNASVDLTTYGNIGSSLKWSRKWNSKLYGNTIISYSNYYNNRDRSSENSFINPDDEERTNMSGIFENNDLKDYTLKSDYQIETGSRSQLQFGVFATYYDIKYSYAQSDTVKILDRDAASLLGGLYLQSKIKLFNDRLHLLPGLRATWFEPTEKFYYEPRFSATYNISDQITIRGSTGKFYQFANRVTREDIMSGSKEFWILSDGSSVPISSSVHFIGGISYESSGYTFSAEGYYKKISNLTEYSLRINASPMEMDYDENFFNGNGYSTGIEFLAQKNAGDFNGWLSYTIGEAKNHFNEYGDGYFPANQDVTHEFKIVGLYKYKRWDFSANWIYATGRPYTAPCGAYTITLLDGTTQDFFTVTAKNSIRLPDYHRFDISAMYKILMGKRSDKKRRELGSVSLSLFNVYNHHNIWYKQFEIEEGEILETNMSYLGITPNITLSLKLR